MNLKEKINNDLKEAMKMQDKLTLNVVRSLRAAILEFEKSGSNKELSPDIEIAILSSASKKRKEAIEQYEKAGRLDLAEIEKNELSIIQKYLPEQLSEDEILAKIKELASEIGASSKADFGKLMPLAIKNLKGKADGDLIRKLVEKILGLS